MVRGTSLVLYQFVIDVARFGHLIGLAMGFGLALYADSNFLRSLWRPLARDEISMLRRLHSFVGLGMLVLWATGLMLLFARTGFAMSEMTPKLIMKLGVVSLLTANSLLIGFFIIPRVPLLTEYRFGELPQTTRLLMLSVGVISTSCWFSGLALGVFSSLKSLDLIWLQLVVGGIFASVIAGAVFLNSVAAEPRRLRLGRQVYAGE